jgi:hypothetical protein
MAGLLDVWGTSLRRRARRKLIGDRVKTHRRSAAAPRLFEHPDNSFIGPARGRATMRTCIQAIAPSAVSGSHHLRRVARCAAPTSTPSAGSDERQPVNGSRCACRRGCDSAPSPGPTKQTDRKYRRSAAGELRELREGFSLEQRRARVLARAADLRADRAVTVMGVARTLLGAARARAHASAKGVVKEHVIGEYGPREEPSGRGADVGASLVERDARPHGIDVVFGQTRIRTCGAGLIATQARVDRRRDLGGAEGSACLGGLQHLLRVAHGTLPSYGP